MGRGAADVDRTIGVSLDFSCLKDGGGDNQRVKYLSENRWHYYFDFCQFMLVRS